MMKKHHGKDSKVVACKTVKSGISVTHTAKIHRCNRTTIWRWMKKSNGGKNFSNLETSARTGRPTLINDKNLLNFRKDILKPATRFGFETDFGTSKRIQIILKKNYKISVTKRTICRWLKSCGLSYHKPEKSYYEANEAEQSTWLKKELPEILKFTLEKKAILYFEDESCIQLGPVVGKTWGPIGKALVRKVTGNKSSISAMSAITKRGDLVFSLLQKKIKTAEIIRFLSNILKHHPRRHVVIIMDRAKPHTSKKTKNFILKQKRLHVFYLPARSPKLNPDEKIWTHLKHQELRDHRATTKKALVSITRKKLSSMSKNRKLIKGIFYRSSVAKLMS